MPQQSPRRGFFVRAGAWIALMLALPACEAAKPPPALRKLELTGTPYERGVQHGRALSSEIRSFYTTMLTTSLLPYLNREQPDIAAVLKSYDPKLHAEYADGQFSLQLLTESALELEKSIPQIYRDEMHGIADGAGVPYQQVLLLNTFVDSTLAARAVTYFLRAMQSPQVVFVELDTFVANQGAAIEHDGVDNDSDGTTDEPNEGRLTYAARPDASFVEVPADARFRVMLQDPDGVDPKSVRLQLVIDGKPVLYTVGSAEMTAQVYVDPQGEAQKDLLEVKLKPPPLPPKSVVTLLIQASDAKIVANPPPAKARTMRIEQLTFSTAGCGKKAHEIANLGASDGTTQPGSLGFAVRNQATADGKPLIGHHFTLLDAGTSHKHCALQIHHQPGKPSFAFVGWAGIAYGFAGVSAQGVGVALTHSDTLNNPLLVRFDKEQLQAKLITSGIPVGFALRRVLEETATAPKASDLLLTMPHSFGWNFIVADAAGEMRAVEVHAAIHPDDSKPVAYGPEAKDANGGPLASVGADDLAIGAHFRALANDMDTVVFAFQVPNQRAWSSYYYPSLRTQAALKQQIAGNYGKFSPARMIDVLRQPALVDFHDSMQASVIEPATRTIRAAAGQVPATAGDFEVFTLPAFAGAK